MAIAHAHPVARLAAALGLALSLAACGGSGGAPAAPECGSPSECPSVGPCLTRTCTGGRCGSTQALPGTLLTDDQPGDCQRYECDGHGAPTHVTDDTDFPIDGNTCTQDLCLVGQPGNPPTDAGTRCTQDAGTRCDGAGACVACQAASDCPGSDTECATRTCSPAGACGITYLPEGTPLASQVPGDCQETVCGLLGATASRPLDTDMPPRLGACFDGTCVGGRPLQRQLDAGTFCSGPGVGGLCDAAGACVQCLTKDDCPGFDTVCAQRTCGAGQCGTSFAPDGTFSDDLGAGDCNAILCDGAGGFNGRPYPLDLPVDGNPCTQDLCSAAGAPSNPPEPAGTACDAGSGKVCDGAGTCVECNVGAECASQVCKSHVCQAATCQDGVRNGAETGVDCGGGSCPGCAPGLPCAIPTDCASLVCRSSTCAAPSCSDQVRNGAETGVDCGGGSCVACALGVTCLQDRDCGSGTCQAGTCGAPRVTGLTPAEGDTAVAPGAGVTLFLSAAVTVSSVTTQAAAGPCAGSVQVSADDFATCLGISARQVATGSKSVTVQPAPPLDGAGPYRVRAAGLATVSQGDFSPFTSSAGFTVASSGGCGSALVVSQIYPGGGQAGATYASDFVELHNRSGATISLEGLSLQLAGAGATAWTAVPLSGAMGPGRYLLVALPGSGLTGSSLPPPDLTGPAALDPTGGKVALVSSVVPQSAVCSAVSVLDLVGWGPAACFEGPGATAAPAPPDAGAALVRAGAGCADGNGNAADFASQLVQPRSAASAAVTCGCNGSAVNGTGLTVEMDFCWIAAPMSLNAQAGLPVGPVWGRVFEERVTDLPGETPLITAQLGYGPPGTDPRYATGWTFLPASYNPASAAPPNEDEYQASFTAPAAGSWLYVYRFSPDGQRWTYCDPDGAGSGSSGGFEPGTLPTMTITP